MLYEYLIVFATIPSKSIPYQSIREESHPYIYILSCRIGSLHHYSSFDRGTDIVPSLLVHLGQDRILRYSEIEYSCVWCEEVFIGFLCIVALYLSIYWLYLEE